VCACMLVCLSLCLCVCARVRLCCVYVCCADRVCVCVCVQVPGPFVLVRFAPVHHLAIERVMVSLVTVLQVAARDPQSTPGLDVDWPSFLGRSDIESSWSRSSASATWDKPGPPLSYDVAGFIGLVDPPHPIPPHRTAPTP
jgi:hypothetical protein